MSAVLDPGPAALRPAPDPQPAALPAPLCFRKDPASPAPELPLSPLEHEILSICLNAPEDPRDVGMLPALLAAEVRFPT